MVRWSLSRAQSRSLLRSLLQRGSPQALLGRALLSLFLCSISLSAINYPSPPQEPTVAQPQVEGTAAKLPANRKSKTVAAAPQMNVRLRIHMGDKSILIAEALIPAAYSFAHKKGHVQYNQTIRAEEIRELVIENYRARKISSAKDGEVYEFEPANVRIELKDGQSFKLPYLFKDVRKIKAKNADGFFSVFAFFADTYKPRVGWQERAGEAAGGSMDLMTRRPHPGAYVKLEYFEPVDKAGVPPGTSEKEPGAPVK